MSRFRTLFLDLDDTLYPPESGVWAAVSTRILEFMMSRLMLRKDQAVAVRRRYVDQYGTTLQGLLLHHAVDPREYMAFVHDVPVARLIRPDLELRQMLEGLPQAKWIFTNADHEHAGKVLRALGIRTAVDGIIDFFDLAPYTKPAPEAYRLAMQIAGEPSADACVLVDDQPRNVEGARRLGMTAVLVGQEAQRGADGHRIGRIADLAACLPELRAQPRGG